MSGGMFKKLLNYRLNGLGWMVYIVIALAGFIDYGLSGGLWTILILFLLFIAGAFIKEFETKMNKVQNIEINIDLTGVKKDEEDNHDW